MNLNWAAIAVAAVVALVTSTAYYIALTEQLTAARVGTGAQATTDARAGRPAPWKIGLELLRNVVLATIVASISSRLGIAEIGPSIALAFALWLAFPVVLWTGAVLWENAPPRLAAIHSGDWLLKVLIIGIVVGLWH